MAMKKDIEPVTNIFEKALYERFLTLEIGDPDERLMEVIRHAGSEVTREVKDILNKDYEARLAKKREIFHKSS